MIEPLLDVARLVLLCYIVVALGVVAVLALAAAGHWSEIVEDLQREEDRLHRPNCPHRREFTGLDVLSGIFEAGIAWPLMIALAVRERRGL